MIKYHSMSWFNREDTKAINSSNTHRGKGRISHVIVTVIVKQGRNESKCASSEKQSKGKSIMSDYYIKKEFSFS